MLKLTITAGAHERRNALLSAALENTDEALAGLSEALPFALRYAGGKTLPAQLVRGEDGKAVLYFVLDFLGKGETAELTLVNTEAHAPAFRAQDKPEDGRLELFANNAYYTAYQYAIGFAKPHIGPIVNKYGENITRYDFEAKEHPHHRSIWFSHGSVTLDGKSEAVDTWNEFEHHGFMKTKAIESTVSGDVLCSFTANNVWTDENGLALCDDHTTVSLTQPEDGVTCLDVDLSLEAVYGDVTLGATKEAGPIAVRMDETLRADRTGTLVSSYGAEGEDEMWMKKACWNDYSGKTAGGHTAGVAVFDNPQNAGYPTYWHSRNYGLFAPNRFYLGSGEKIPAGTSLRFCYRIVIHEGDTEDADIRGKFLDYIAPAKVAVQII